MSTATAKAHFDGEAIQLDDPLRLDRDAQLLVTVLPPRSKIDPDREVWLSLSMKGLAEAYAEDEPEYTLDMIREANPDYARR